MIYDPKAMAKDMTKKARTFAEGGKKGGSVKGDQKRRDPAHYYFIGKLRAEIQRRGRPLTERERANFKAKCQREFAAKN